MQFIAQSEIECELPGDAEFIGDKEVISPAQLLIDEIRKRACGRGRNAEHEVGIREAGEAVGEGRTAEEVRSAETSDPAVGTLPSA